MLKQLRRRFLLDTMVLALIIIIGSTALLIVSAYTYQQNAANETMRDLLNTVTDRTVKLQKGLEKDAQEVLFDREELDLRDDSGIIILSEDGKVLGSAVPNKSFRKDVTGSLNTIVDYVLTAKEDSGIIAAQPMRYMRQPLKGIGTKVAIMNRAGELKAIYFQFRLYMVLAFIILILLIILCNFLAQRSILPVDEAIRTQQQFIADASHELKTPLTVILANLAILSDSPDATIEESQKWIENTKSEANRMSKLVGEMLFLARSDAAMDMNYHFRMLNFGDIVDEVVLPTEALAFERNITLESKIDDNALIIGDEGRLKQLVMILVENATKYVDENGTIRVELSSAPRRGVVLTVTNTGTPIPPEKSEHIFDRFYRVDESRVRDKGGYGLGLSIAQKIAQKHNGEVALDYSDATGTCFSIRLPHANSLRAPDLSPIQEEPKSEEKKAEA